MPKQFPGREFDIQSPYVISILDYGAKGDNSTDCTKAFQEALEHASTNQARVVYAPPGLHVFQSSIRTLPGVTLRGSYNYVPSHPGSQSLDDGTVLIPVGGRGDDNPSSRFIEVTANVALTGVMIFHKEQEKSQPRFCIHGPF